MGFSGDRAFVHQIHMFQLSSTSCVKAFPHHFAFPSDIALDCHCQIFLM